MSITDGQVVLRPHRDTGELWSGTACMRMSWQGTACKRSYREGAAVGGMQSTRPAVALHAMPCLAVAECCPTSPPHSPLATAVSGGMPLCAAPRCSTCDASLPLHAAPRSHGRRGGGPSAVGVAHRLTGLPPSHGGAGAAGDARCLLVLKSLPSAHDFSQYRLCRWAITTPHVTWFSREWSPPNGRPRMVAPERSSPLPTTGECLANLLSWVAGAAGPGTSGGRRSLLHFHGRPRG